MVRRPTLGDRLLEQSTHEYSPRTRLVAMLFLAPVFLVALPCLFIRLGAQLDAAMQWPPALPPPSNLMPSSPRVVATPLPAPTGDLTRDAAERYPNP